MGWFHRLLQIRLPRHELLVPRNLTKNTRAWLRHGDNGGHAHFPPALPAHLHIPDKSNTSLGKQLNVQGTFLLCYSPACGSFYKRGLPGP